MVTLALPSKLAAVAVIVVPPVAANPIVLAVASLTTDNGVALPSPVIVVSCETAVIPPPGAAVQERFPAPSVERIFVFAPPVSLNAPTAIVFVPVIVCAPAISTDRE